MSRNQAKKSQPCHMRGAHSGCFARGGAPAVGVAAVVAIVRSCAADEVIGDILASGLRLASARADTEATERINAEQHERDPDQREALPGSIAQRLVEQKNRKEELDAWRGILQKAKHRQRQTPGRLAK